MKSYLLVFDDGNDDEFKVSAFVESLDEGAACYTLDGHVCFFRSGLPIETIEESLLKLAGSRLFFVTEVGDVNYGGRMLPEHWEFIRPANRLSSAA